MIIILNMKKSHLEKVNFFQIQRADEREDSVPSLTVSKGHAFVHYAMLFV